MTGSVARNILDDDDILEAIFSPNHQEGPVRQLSSVQTLLRKILETIRKRDVMNDVVPCRDDKKEKIMGKLKRYISMLKRTVLILLDRKDCEHLPDYLHIVVYHIVDLLEKHGELTCFNQQGAEGMNDEFRRFWKTTSFGMRGPRRMLWSGDGKTLHDITVTSSKTSQLIDAAAFLCCAQSAGMSLSHGTDDG